MPRLPSRGPAGVADERANLVAARGQRARQMAAGKPGGAGYEDAHRSATSVTGDPKKPSRPARSSSRSVAVVKRRDPIAL